MIRSKLLLLAAGFFVRQCATQASGWQLGQVNSTMCLWDSPRAAVVRDTVYIDGGYLSWQAGMNDGTYSPPTADGNPLGIVYLLNFSTPFNTSAGSNLTDVFTTISKASNGGAANNVGPQYYDGAMFANDYGWTTFGGLLDQTDSFRPPAADSVATYQVYPQGNQQFTRGFTLDQLPNGMTRYITNGASVSVPSENLGFYFSGLRSASSGPIYYQPGPRNGTFRAEYETNTMVQLDMSSQQRSVWSNETLPTTVPGRVNAELVWVPIGSRGILVAIGGVINPSFANVNQTNNASATLESTTQSPKFMNPVAVYDIEKKSWYEQPTDGAPPQLTQGCTVLASAQDGTSHNIYWYGGFDGLNPTKPFSDDVWILSIPSFMWMKVKSGVPSHGRAGHRCVKPYPDQMFVIGGYTSLSGTTPTCVEGGIVQIFNLSSAEWIDSYSPSVWSKYTIPPMIWAMIGGTGTGSATQAAPSPSGFANSSMTSLFATPYNSSKIATWYPYAASATPTNNRPIISPSVVAEKSSGTPAYLAPVLGVVLGLFFLTLVGLGILLWRRRQLFKKNGTATQSEAGTLDNRRWVSNWLRSTPVDAKAPTVTTDETPSSPDPYDEVERPYVPEMGDSQVHEMPDSSLPTELAGTGFVPLAAGNKPSKSSRGHMTHSPSTASQASSISRLSHTSSPHRPGISPVHSPRADSPPLGGDDTRYSSHMRGISDTSVSTDGAFATPSEVAGSRSVEGVGPRPGVVSPLGNEEEAESGVYLGNEERQAPGKEKRKSNFEEGLDDVDEKRR